MKLSKDMKFKKLGALSITRAIVTTGEFEKEGINKGPLLMHISRMEKTSDTYSVSAIGNTDSQCAV